MYLYLWPADCTHRRRRIWKCEWQWQWQTRCRILCWRVSGVGQQGSLSLTSSVPSKCQSPGSSVSRVAPIEQGLFNLQLRSARKQPEQAKQPNPGVFFVRCIARNTSNLTVLTRQASKGCAQDNKQSQLTPRTGLDWTGLELDLQLLSSTKPIQSPNQPPRPSSVQATATITSKGKSIVIKNP